MKKILKKYLKITGGFYYPKIEDKKQFNNINSEKIIRMDKNDFILVDSEGYIVDIKTLERIEDVVSHQSIKYVDAFFLNGYIWDINELYEYVQRQLQHERKSKQEITDYYRKHILDDDIVKILNFYENRKQSEKLLKIIPITINNKHSP